ncbi:MAG TPA: hypothetical protein VJN96_11085 [Vicinamibacterales bacterium]|nr:hypothetical protein [Vicinamibacterales bacterium]
MTIVIVAFSLLTMQSPQSAAIVPPPHVRPQGVRSEDILKDAIKRSPTVAGLVKVIERSPIIVFIELAYDREDLGRTTILAANDIARLLHVQLNGKLSADRLVEVLGHELTHAIEILREPEVRDDSSLARVFTRVGFEMERGHFETDAAQQAELQVHTELTMERAARRGKGKKPLSS